MENVLRAQLAEMRRIAEDAQLLAQAVRPNAAMSKNHCPENSCAPDSHKLPWERDAFFRLSVIATEEWIDLKSPPRIQIAAQNIIFSGPSEALTMNALLQALLQTPPQTRLKRRLSRWLPFPNNVRRKNLLKLFRCGWERSYDKYNWPPSHFCAVLKQICIVW